MDDRARDEVRRTIAARGLTPRAAAYLTRDALGRIELEQLAPVKGLLKRYFSDAPWTSDDADELAARVGPGEGWWRHELDGGIGLAFGWRDGAFRLEVEHSETTSARSEDVTAPALDDAFDSALVPEATPNPRTIRFVTGRIHDGASRWYESAAGVDDPRVARVFEVFDDVANVLVGPDFVAVGIRRPDRWDQLLGPMLRVLEAEFPAERAHATEANPADRAPSTAGSAPTEPSVRAPASARDRAFDRVWRDLRALHLERPDDVERLLAAASSGDVPSRQVAARVLLDADPQVALTAWDALVADPSRTVRRATVDAMVDAARPELRPLLERALDDHDAWTRWKALRGLVDLGIEPSRAAATPLATDTDFRVRLEAVRALRDASGSSLRG